MIMQRASTRLKGPRKTRSRRRGAVKVIPSDISSFLSFGLYSTVCVGLFLVIYISFLAILVPTLNENSPSGVAEREKIARAVVFVRGRLGNFRNIQSSGAKAERLIAAASAEFDAERQRSLDKEVAKRVNSNLNGRRAGQLVRNAASPSVKDDLFLKPPAESHSLAQAKDQVGFIHAEAYAPQAVQEGRGETAPKGLDGERRGFVVLGMHRSGTSMLSGLLVTGMGYKTGGPLIKPAFDNEKGFFERIDIVNQNDEFFKAQKMNWAANVVKYDWKKALEQKKTGKVPFKRGQSGLDFLNNKANAPWLQKDPRMCITLRTWVELMNSEPAVVYTYRHPLEVAMSIKKRQKNISLETGMRLWIVYNMRAIQNSAGLCRVLSSNESIFTDTLREVQRISDELTERCKVPKPPHRIDQATVDQFVDPNLQHNRKKREEGAKERKIVAVHGGSEDDPKACIVRDYTSDFLEGTPMRVRETQMYLKAMKVYCDLQSRDAYKEGYEWPTLF